MANTLWFLRRTSRIRTDRRRARMPLSSYHPIRECRGVRRARRHQTTSVTRRGRYAHCRLRRANGAVRFTRNASEVSAMPGLRKTVCILVLVSAALVLPYPAAAQADQGWQPIDPADLKLKDNPKEPGGPAMILDVWDDFDNPHSTE